MDYSSPWTTHTNVYEKYPERMEFILIVGIHVFWHLPAVIFLSSAFPDKNPTFKSVYSIRDRWSIRQTEFLISLPRRNSNPIMSWSPYKHQELTIFNQDPSCLIYDVSLVFYWQLIKAAVIRPCTTCLITFVNVNIQVEENRLL